MNLPQRNPRQSLHSDRKWRHRLFSVCSQIAKTCSFWVMFGSRLISGYRFNRFRKGLQFWKGWYKCLIFGLVTIAHFYFLTTKAGFKWTYGHPCITQIAILVLYTTVTLGWVSSCFALPHQLVGFLVIHAIDRMHYFRSTKLSLSKERKMSSWHNSLATYRITVGRVEMFWRQINKSKRGKI